MRFPTEEDLTTRPPQTPPASMAPMPSSPLSSHIFPSLSPSPPPPFKPYRLRRTFPHLSLFASAYHFPHLCLQPRYLPLSLASPGSSSLFPIRHLSQQSMPFHPGEGTNGIPAESSSQRLFCDADSFPSHCNMNPQI